MRLRRWRLNESYKWVHDRRAVVSLQDGDTRSHLRCSPGSAAHGVVSLVDAVFHQKHSAQDSPVFLAKFLPRFCTRTGEAARLQHLEVQLLGESSTGFRAEPAQQSPGSSQQLVTASPYVALTVYASKVLT